MKLTSPGPLLAALKQSTVLLINQRDVDFDSATNSDGEYDCLGDRELIAEQDAQIAKNQAAIRKAEGLDAKGLDRRRATAAEPGRK